MNGMFSIHLCALFSLPFNFGWLEQSLVSDEAVYRLLVACALGGLVGIEREALRRAAGVRTNMLICMGCAFFTLLSAVLAGDGNPDKGRVASNIVQGIGFLGAGLILHNRNRVSGLASAASVFVVASIGMACGAGLYIPAIIATLIVLFALALVGFLERRVNLKIYPLLYEARGTDETAMLVSILEAMDREQERLGNPEADAIGTMKRISFTLTATKRQHERLGASLLAEPAIDDLKIFRDPEED
ncbi:MgtC/SapB family protein [Acidicapsa ligni]|uniref:MgtC/SapB family protein n=1 Tax=Acidicapsa ligni TaxID=542300 RepID=UPI0021E04DFE|nr:MgtC/SapB family protein [Acidicapsa ligni]